MKKFSSILILILISFISLSAQSNENTTWTIGAVAETSGMDPDNIDWSSRAFLITHAYLRNDTFLIEDFDTFHIGNLRKEIQGFAKRKIYTFTDEYGQTGTIVFQTDPTNMDDDHRYLIFVLFDNAVKGRVFIANKPRITQTGNNHDEDAVPFVMVEEKPSFMGGDANQFSKWVNMHLVYPEDAKISGIQGRVTTEFTVGSDGKVYNIKVLNGVHPSLDAEAVRVISMSPRWTPGRQKEKAVPVVFTFPVIFKLR